MLRTYCMFEIFKIPRWKFCVKRGKILGLKRGEALNEPSQADNFSLCDIILILKKNGNWKF